MDLLNYEEKPQTRTGFFWWSVIILLLTGACFASWIGSFYIVAHPENPRCYRILKKLKRLDPPKRFVETQVPTGDFLTVAQMLERFGKIGPEELALRNDEMLRAYLMNFRETKKPPVYVIGRFDLVDTHQLGKGDLFPSGAAIVAQSLDSPQVLLEAIFPARPKTASAIRTSLSTGTDFTLARSRDLLALIHVARLADGRMQFTAIPLPYGGWQVRRAGGEFHLSSPEELEKLDVNLGIDVAAGLPIVRGERLKTGIAAYAEYRRKTLASNRDETAADPELVRFDAVKEDADHAITPKVVRPVVAPTPRPMPTPAPAVPLPIRPVTIGPGSAIAPAPIIPKPAVPTIVKPAPVEDAPRPKIVEPPAGNRVDPKPPNVATPPPAATPGAPAVPRRVVSVREATQLAGSDAAAAQAVLSGDFVVTTVKGQRVEMRTQEVTGVEPSATDAAPVIVVDFPPGSKLPGTGTVIRRDARKGFVIRDVTRTTDGRVTIVATE